MATNVRLTWVIPEPTSRQSAIESVRIDARVEGIDEWTEINVKPASDPELLIEQVPPGTWHYRAVAIDAQGRESADPPVVSVDMPLALPPDVTELTAAIE